jgi:hypothetical protein
MYPAGLVPANTYGILVERSSTSVQNFSPWLGTIRATIPANPLFSGDRSAERNSTVSPKLAE